MVNAYNQASKKMEKKDKELKDFIEAQSSQLAEILASKTGAISAGGAEAGAGETARQEDAGALAALPEENAIRSILI